MSSSPELESLLVSDLKQFSQNSPTDLQSAGLRHCGDQLIVNINLIENICVNKYKIICIIKIIKISPLFVRWKLKPFWFAQPHSWTHSRRNPPGLPEHEIFFRTWTKIFSDNSFLPPGSLRRSSGLSLTLSQQQQTLLKSLLMMIFIEKDWKKIRDKMLSTWSVRNDWGVWGSVSCTTTDWSLNFLREFHQPRKINCCLQLQVVRTVLLNIEINNYGLLCNSFLCKRSTTLTPLQ